MNSVNPYIIRRPPGGRARSIGRPGRLYIFKEMVEAFKEPYEQKSQYKVIVHQADEIVYQTFVVQSRLLVPSKVELIDEIIRF